MGPGKSSVALLAVIVCLSVSSRADFKYTESSKMTGGAMMGAVKFLGAFSKDARQATAPQISSRAVKGSRFREERADGTIEIIDLDGRRFININSKEKTYTILTFEQMKQQMLQAQQRMKEEQAKQAGQHPNSNLKITPKIESSETGATRNILGLDTKEAKVKIEMLMESDDPKAKGQQISTVMNTDSWIAATVPGYDEVRQFYVKMAKEMDWVPDAMTSGMANSNVQISMAELKKNNIKLGGMPLLQTMSMTLGGNGMPPADASGQPPASTPPPPPPPAQTQEPTSAKDAITQSIAGHFGLGGFGKKKKTEQPPASQPAPADSSQAASTPASAAAPAGTPGALMEMTIEVTSFSNSALDKSLFDVPAGYTQVQPDPEAKPGKH